MNSELEKQLADAEKRQSIASCKTCGMWQVAYLPKKMFGELYTNG